jgi:formylglycine-generating enzyme required for sulfatase activity
MRPLQKASGHSIPKSAVVVLSNGSYLEQTTAVGIYPHSESPYHVSDMTGNVWEWARIAQRQENESGVQSDEFAALYGSSWFNDSFELGYRNVSGSEARMNTRGFRVISYAPIASDLCA